MAKGTKGTIGKEELAREVNYAIFKDCPCCDSFGELAFDPLGGLVLKNKEDEERVARKYAEDLEAVIRPYRAEKYLVRLSKYLLEKEGISASPSEIAEALTHLLDTEKRKIPERIRAAIEKAKARQIPKPRWYPYGI